MSDDWWRGFVIYQIYPRSFADSNGDGVGDLAGITGKLDYVAALGVDGIWLSPFFVSPMTDFGYDVANYRDVDPLFGTLADFDALLARAHSLGLKVLIDTVWAHSSDRHPWFVESRSARNGPRADWYVWAPPRLDGTPPNNWLGVFGGGAWTWEPRRRQYYLHHFLPSQPKLNLRNPAVLNELLDIGAFWLERGVDGFRLDAVDFLLHDEALRDNPPASSLAETPVKPFQMQRHLYDSGGSDVLPLMERMRALADRFPGAVMVAEVGGETTDLSSIARAASYVGTGGERIHGAYSLAQMKSRGDATSIRDAIREVADRLPGGGMVWSFSNHDVVRVVSRWGDGSAAAAKMFMALVLSMPGGAFVYQGEELGLPEAEVPFERLQDPYGQNYWPDFKGRDGCRTPMPWVANEKNAGFSRADTTWLPVPDAHHGLAVDRQEADRASVLHAWRRFLRWRKRHPALLGGTFELIETPDPFVAFTRRGGERLLCVFNMAPEPGDLVLPVDGFGAVGTELRIRLAGYGAYFARDGKGPVDVDGEIQAEASS